MKRAIATLSMVLFAVIAVAAFQGDIAVGQGFTKQGGGGGGNQPLGANFRMNTGDLVLGGYQAQVSPVPAIANGINKLSFVNRTVPNYINYNDDLALRNYSAALLKYNSPTLELGNAATNSGKLEFSSIHRGDHVTTVNFEQKARLSNGIYVPVIGGSVSFIYSNTLNASTNIPNLTQAKAVAYRNVDGFTPPTLSSLTAAASALQVAIPVSREMNDTPPADPQVMPTPATEYEILVGDTELPPTDPQVENGIDNPAFTPENGHIVTMNGTFQVETIDTDQHPPRLAVLVLPNQSARLVYEIAASGPMNGITKQYYDYVTQNFATTTVRASYVLYLDAYDGSLVHSVEAEAHGLGVGRVYDPNPIEGGGLMHTLPLSQLPGAGSLENGYLRGPYVQVHDTLQLGDANCPEGTMGNNPTGCTNLNFDFTGYQFPLNVLGAQTNAYHGVNYSHEYLVGLGFPSLMNFPIWVEALDYTHISSVYDYSITKIFYDSAWIDSYDMDVVSHEYFHAVQHDIGKATNSPGPFNFPFDPTSLNGTSAFQEGSADYFATSRLNDLEFAETPGQSQTTGYLRKLDTYKNAADNWNQQLYDDGEIWGTALYRLRNMLGKGIVDPIVVQTVYHTLPSDNTQQIVENFRLAANVLYPSGTGYSIYDDQIRAVFSLHKLDGTGTPYNWSARLGVGPGKIQAMSDRPYRDTWNGSSWVGYTYNATFDATNTIDPGTNLPTIQAGSPSVRLVFDQYSDCNKGDVIRIKDVNDVVVATFDYRPTGGHGGCGGDQVNPLRGRVVTVPGDTAKVEIVSAPDGLGAPGIGFLSIKSYDPNIQGPPNNNPPFIDVFAPGFLTQVSTSSTDPVAFDIDLSAASDPDGDTIVSYEILPQRWLKGQALISLDPGANGGNLKARHIYNRRLWWPILSTGGFGIGVTLTDSNGNKATYWRGTGPIDPYVVP